MTKRELAQLETLLKKYRADHTWSINPHLRREGHDAFRRHADAVLSDVRSLRALGAFYALDELAVKGGA